MKALLFAVILSLAGCATVGSISENALPRIGAGLQASEALYRAACMPEPLPKLDATCEAAKAGINDAVSVYTEINDQVKAAQ